MTERTGLELVADEEVELVEQVRRDDASPGDVDLVLVVGGVGGGFGEGGAASAVILGGSIFVGVAGPELVAAAGVVEESGGGEVVVFGGRDGFMDGASGEDGVDDGLGVVGVRFAVEEEGVVFRMAEGTGEGAFLVEAALGRLDGRERVAGVEDGVAEEEVEGAVEFLGAFFGGDFNASTSGAGEEGGVGILVDLDVLDGGGGNAGAVDFHAVDDERDAVGAGGVVGKEAREGADVVHVEDGEVIEVSTIDSVGGLVVGGFDGELRGVAGVDGDALLDACEVEGDFQGERGAGVKRDEAVIEAFVMDAQAIPGGFGEGEGEGAGL